MLDQEPRDRVQFADVVAEDGIGQLVGLLDHAADLVVDLAGNLLRIVGLGTDVAAQERLVVVVTEHARTELLGHAVAHDHLFGRAGDFVQVVSRPRGHLLEDDLLSGPPTEGHRHPVHEG